MLRISILLILGLYSASALNATAEASKHFEIFFHAVEKNDLDVMMLLVNDKNRKHLEPFVALFENVNYELTSTNLLENGTINANVTLTNKSMWYQRFLTFSLVENWISPTGWTINSISMTPAPGKYQRKIDFSDFIFCAVNMFVCTCNMFAAAFG